MDISNIDVSDWPIWLIAVMVFVYLFKDQLGVFVPRSIHRYFQNKQRNRILTIEHQQEIEENALGSAMQQAAVSVQQQISVNKRLIDFITTEVVNRIEKLEEQIAHLNSVLATSVAKGEIVQVELSRLVDTINDLKITITKIHSLLVSLVAGRYVDGYVDGEEIADGCE